MAEKGKVIEVAEGDNPCATLGRCAASVRQTMNGAAAVDKDCSEEASPEHCFVATDINHAFYSRVGNKLDKYYLNEMFTGFVDSLNEDQVFMRKLHDMFGTQAGKEANTTLQFKFLDNDNHKYCSDIIVILFINRAYGEGGKKNICHISLHSESPNYKTIAVSQGTRSGVRAGCTFYEKGPPGTTAGESSAFHYKIENFFWTPGASKYTLKEHQQPWKNLNINNSTPPMFLSDHHEFDMDRKELCEIWNTPLKAWSNCNNILTRGEKVHNEIYNKFIKEWNAYVKGDSLKRHADVMLGVPRFPRKSTSRSRSRSQSRSNSSVREGGSRTRRRARRKNTTRRRMARR